VVYDGSCGWEVVTPILKGEPGFQTVQKYLNKISVDGVLEKLNLDVNHSTGTHIHLGWDFRDPHIVQRLLKFMRAYEPSLFSLVPPRRVLGPDGRPNEYCAAIQTRFSTEEIDELGTKRELKSIFRDYDERYHTVNLTKYADPVQVLEVRLHGGTVEAEKILLWISLWMCLLPRLSSEHASIPDTGNNKDILLPNGDENSDIISVLVNFAGLSATEEVPFLDKIYRRREQVFCSNSYWLEKMGKNHEQAVKMFRDRAKGLLQETTS